MNQLTTLQSACLSIIVFFLSAAYASDAAAQQASVGASKFVKAKLLQRARAVFPLESKEKKRDGSVEMSFMVDNKGKVYAPFVLRSSHQDFEQAALTAVKKYQYKPATQGGSAVESRESIRIFFKSESAGETAGPEFGELYQLVENELAQPNPNNTLIESSFEKMRNAFQLNSYSLAYLSTLEVSYYSKFGTQQQQINAINQLLLFEKRVSDYVGLLDDERLKKLRQRLIVLQFESGYLNEAVLNYRKLHKEDKSATEPLKEIIQRARDIVKKGTPFSTKVNLNDSGSQEVLLMGSKFYFDNLDGSIEKLIFRCQKKYSTIDYKADFEFMVPKIWGFCWMQITGQSRAKADLVQFK